MLIPKILYMLLFSVFERGVRFLFFKIKHKEDNPVPKKLPLSVKEAVETNIIREAPEKPILPQKTKKDSSQKAPETLFGFLKHDKQIKQPEPISSKTIKHIKHDTTTTKGFFSNFARFLSSKELDDSMLKDLLSHDFLHKMKSFHEAITTGRFAFVHEEDVKTALNNALMVLEELEAEWIERKKAYDKAFEALTEKEAEIDERVSEVKALLQKAALIRQLKTEIPRDKWFFTVNGLAFRNVFELRAALPEMPEWVFAHHCNANKNDFATWVKHVFKAENLADRMLKAKTKNDLIATLSEL